jgi:hypothetical protein
VRVRVPTLNLSPVSESKFVKLLTFEKFLNRIIVTNHLALNCLLFSFSFFMGGGKDDNCWFNFEGSVQKILTAKC